MLKILSLFFLFIFAFSAGTIVGSHFKDQIDSGSTAVANKIKSIDKEKIIRGTIKDQLKKIAEEGTPAPQEKFAPKNSPKAVSRKLPQKKRIRPNSAKRREGKYTVQIASFPSKNLADNMVKKLKKQGYDALSFSAVVKGNTWHRVGIGSFPTIGEANITQRQLVLKKVARGSIISKINP